MKTPQEWINEDGLPDHYADQIRILADIQADARAELLERCAATEQLRSIATGMLESCEAQLAEQAGLVREAMELLHHTEKLGERISEEEWSRRYFALLARTAPKEAT